MDEFAQTRGADDLFDDEIIPLTAEEQAADLNAQSQCETKQKNKGTQDRLQEHPPPVETVTRPRAGDRGTVWTRKGRGRGARASSHGSNQRCSDGGAGGSTDECTNGDTTKEKTEEAADDVSAEGTSEVLPKDGDGSDSVVSPGAESASAVNLAEAARVPAVRGDRSATGGVKKPKLTEEELAERMAAAKLRAAEKAAAHARAEADQASFLEREKLAAEKRKEEFHNLHAMDSERERNRLRKMNALSGREWDATKREEDYDPPSRESRFRRGMHGGVRGYARRNLDGYWGANDSSASYNNGFQGSGRGRPGGRKWSDADSGGDNPAAANGHAEDASTTETEPTSSTPRLDNEVEFPSLPGNDGKSSDAALKPQTSDVDKLLPVTSGGTWAEITEES